MNYENPNQFKYDPHLFISVHPWGSNHGLCTSFLEQEKSTSQDSKCDFALSAHDHTSMDIRDQNANAFFTNRQFL